MKIKPLNDSQLHPDWVSWENFLTQCEVRDTYEGIIYYGMTNCNYILFPTGDLIENYGYNGHGLMYRIREEGAEKVLNKMKENRAEIKRIIGN